MTWLAWRQQRTETLLAVALVALLAVIFIPAGLRMSDAYQSDGAQACVATAGPACERLLNEFDDRFATTIGITDWFSLLPILVATLFAAPFVLELERGTYRLAWTQSVTRRRWLSIKFALILGGSALCAATLAILLTWWREPLDHFHGRIEPGAFQLEGIVPVAYTLFASALVIVFGAVLRRTIAAIALATVAFLAVRITIESAIRPHFAPGVPVTRNTDLATAWVVNHTYQPSSRFWDFQTIETAIYAVLTLAALGIAAWWIDHRAT